MTAVWLRDGLNRRFADIKSNANLIAATLLDTRYFFLFFACGWKWRVFYFLLFFGQKNKLAFSVLLFFRPFTVGLYSTQYHRDPFITCWDTQQSVSLLYSAVKSRTKWTRIHDNSIATKIASLHKYLNKPYTEFHQNNNSLSPADKQTDGRTDNYITSADYGRGENVYIIHRQHWWLKHILTLTFLPVSLHFLSHHFFSYPTKPIPSFSSPSRSPHPFDLSLPPLLSKLISDRLNHEKQETYSGTSLSDIQKWGPCTLSSW